MFRVELLLHLSLIPLLFLGISIEVSTILLYKQSNGINLSILLYTVYLVLYIFVVCAISLAFHFLLLILAGYSCPSTSNARAHKQTHRSRRA